MASEQRQGTSGGELEQTFGWLLQQARLAAGLSQEALAERAGLSARAISALERGVNRAPHLDTVSRLAAALGVTAEQRATLLAAARPGQLAPTSGRATHNLPVALTPLLGRDHDGAAVVRLLQREEVRLLTLTGLGGVGKTRLALQVAGEVRSAYPEGVWLVELAPLSDPSLVPYAVAQTLGLREAAGRPMLETLRAYLATRRVLLVLDNCEHLVAACADLASALLQGCAHVHLLATSREGLGVAGERLYRVPSLSAPPLDHLPAFAQLGRYAAVALFVARAQERWAAFALTGQNAPAVARVCARLDGLPLALELAAAWVGVLPVEAVAARLDDHLQLLTGGPRTALPRQRTLRATLDWSYALLSASEQRLLQRLAVFAGSWTLAAAETICGGDGLEGGGVLAGLAGLVNKSLVLWEDAGGDAPAGRYRLLETVRQYARWRLDESGEAADERQAHAAYFLALAEQGERAMWGGPEQRRWLVELEAEHDNLRAALAWAEEAGDEHLRLRLAAALGRFWFIRGHATEGRRQLERALAATPVADAALRARALSLLGHLVRQAEPARAVALCDESLVLFRSLGDDFWTAYTLFSLGHAWRDQGDWRRAMEALEASLVLSAGRGGAWGFVRGLPLVILGWLLLERGEERRAVALLEEALTLGRALGDQVAIGTALIGLGWAAHYAGEEARAVALAEEALALFRALGHHQGSLDALASLGWVRLAEGDSERSAAVFREGLVMAHERGGQAHVADYLGGLGAVAGSRGQVRQAATVFGAAQRLREAAGTPPYPSGAAYARAVAAARAQLDEATWHAAWDMGQVLTVEQAIAYAREDGQSPTAPPSRSAHE